MSGKTFTFLPLFPLRSKTICFSSHSSLSLSLSSSPKQTTTTPTSAFLSSNTIFMLFPFFSRSPSPSPTPPVTTPMMSKWLSLTASRDWYYRLTFANAGLRSVSTNLGDGTIIHCWVPKEPSPSKPTLVLIHGFGANAMWQWSGVLNPLIECFNVYVPDLLFFGDSHTTRPERSEMFQAQCIVRMMERFGVKKMNLVGLSYGGFVGYMLAAEYREMVDRVVLCCAGVCMDENDLKQGLFKVANMDEAISVLLPQTPDKLKFLIEMSYAKPPKTLPNYFLRDFIEVMCKDYIKEKKELIHAVLRDRKVCDLPRITQPTLIIWGEQDQIFPLELGHRLKRHTGENAELVVIKDTGHALNMEKPKEFCKHLRAFLVDSAPPSSSPNN